MNCSFISDTEDGNDVYSINFNNYSTSPFVFQDFDSVFSNKSDDDNNIYHLKFKMVMQELIINSLKKDLELYKDYYEKWKKFLNTFLK